MFNRERGSGQEGLQGDMMCEGGVCQAREWGSGGRQSRCEACFPEMEKVQGTGEIDNSCVEWKKSGVRGDQ